MKTTSKELKEIQEQIRIVVEPLERKEKELRKILEQEETEKKRAQFQKLCEKIFYTEKHPYKGNSICLIKPLSCNDFSEYGSCNVVQIEVENYDNKNFRINFSYDTCRVDTLPLMKEITPELFDKVKNAAELGLQNSLSLFNVVESLDCKHEYPTSMEECFPRYCIKCKEMEKSKLP